MSSSKQVATKGARKFILEEDNPDVGCYLYVYENGVSISDSLQDSEQEAKEEAKEKWGVEFNAWK